MKYELIGPNLYMDKVGSLYTQNGTSYVPLVNKVTEAENRYVQKHLKGANKHEKN